jgi:hypothetical protein
MRARFRLMPPLLLAILVGIAPPPAHCDDPAQSPAADVDRLPLRYRWVKVPLEQWKDWAPEGPGHIYLRMDADDFKKKIRDIETASRAGGPTEAANVTSASYEARLDGHELVDGKAVLDVAYSGSQTTRMALAPCGLAIGRATWADREEEPAKMGLGSRKRLEVLVSRPGQLAFDWSLAGKRSGQGAIDFQLELPPSPAIHLALELPDGMTPVLERGIAVAEASARNQFTRWRIELGGHHRISLRVVPAEDANYLARLPHLRQSLTYDFSTLGVKLYARLRLDVINEPIRQLALITDADLRLIKVIQGAQSVPWSVAPTPGDESTRRVIIEFPEPLQGTGREFLISAVAPLKLDRPWRLPGLRAEGVVWQQTEESKATLRIRRPLLVKKLVAIGGRQSTPLREGQFGGASADDVTAEPLKGETVEVQYFSTDSGVEVVISQPDSPLQVDCGYAIELDDGETTARVAADFRLAQGERFTLEADVTRQWIIDSVESDPPDALADWSESKNGSPRRLTLRLAKAVAPDQPVRIVINGRRLRSPVGRDHAVKDLIPLQFDASEGGRRLAWLRATEPYQLGLRGDERVNWVNPQSLDEASSTLFAEPPGELLFENDARAANLAVKLETRKPDYSGRIRTEVSVSGTSMVERYRLQCDPNVGRIDRVVVHFSEPMTGDLRWDHETEDEVRPIIEPPRPNGQTDGALQEGRTWEIRLKPPRSEPFNITVTRTTQLTERRPISLASLPEASSQEGLVIVYSSGSAAVRIENNGLKQIPCEAAPIGEYSAARATYSYDPARIASGEIAPLCIAPGLTVARPPSAWVWSCQLQSRFQADGLGRHLATYRLQSAGKEQLRITLPAGVEAVDGAWIDGTPVVCRETDGMEVGHLAIDLPAKRKFPVVAIHFTTDGPRLNHIRGVRAPLPSVDVPTLSRQWTIWLPPGYEALLGDYQPQASWSSSLSWPRRLFGPLGRPANQGPPDPFNPEDWARLFGRQPTREWATARTVKLLEDISRQLQQMERDRKTDPLDWGTLLANASTQVLSADIADDDPELVLLIDPEALTNVEVTPRTAVVTSPRGPSAANGIAILNRANLLLLVHERAILLTGADRAEIDAGQLEPFEDQMLWWVRPGQLADQIEATLAQVPGHPFIPATQWADRPAPARSPWKTSQTSGRQPMDTLGWTAYRVEVADEAPVEVLVIRSHTLRSTRWIAFLALVSLAWWKLLYRPAVVIAMAGMFALGAFLLPPLLAPIASGGLIAMLSVLGFRLTSSDFAGFDAGEHSTEESESGLWSTAVIKVGVLILTVGLILAISSSAWGQQPNAIPAALGQVHEVYVPVDENGEPTGEEYWVSGAFYGELSRQADALAARPQDWLLGAITYRAALSWESAPKRLVLSDLTAVYDLILLDSPATVRIEPLVAAGTPLLLKGTKLDGATIYPIWQEDLEEGGARVFEVTGEDRCRLELTFQTPTARTDGTPRGFELTIPPLASSRLELKLPPDAPEIEIPKAVGAVTRREDSSLLVAELGATDRLTVLWHDATRVTVDELLWLKIGPSSVILDAQFKFRVGEGQLKEVLLTVDPRLVRQDPYESDSVEIVEGDRIPGRSPPEPQTVPLEFDRPVSDEVTVKANLKLRDTLGVGNLLLPRLESRGSVVGKRWLAVSVDPALDRSEQGSQHGESLSLPEFMEAWGEVDVQLLDSAYDLSSGGPSWSIVTKLRKPETTASQTLAVTFSPEEAILDFEATLATEGGDRYQYVLSTPPGLAIARISVVQDDEEHVARWATAPDNKTTVFLNAAVTGRHKMTLEGQLRAVNRSQIPLPVIQIEGVERPSSRIYLLRQPQVQIQVSNLNGLEEMEIGPMDETPKGPGRLVQCFQVTGEESVAAQVALTPNRPTLSADQVTTLTHDGDSWNAKIDYRLAISGGVVDELRLSMPPELNGPFEIDPVMAFEPPGEGNRQLTIRPRTPIEGDFRFSILAPLEIAPRDRVSVPEVILEDTRLREHQLVLPTQFQTRPVEWETQDLRKTELDDDLLPPSLVARESFVAYRVTGPSFSATIRPLGGNAEVYLADISVAWHRDGESHGVATFDLESANLLECPLNVPEGHRLVQVTVGGTQVMPTPMATNRWLLPLGPNSLPQRIEVVFDGSVSKPKADGLMKFGAPTLGNLPVRKTLWTISGPSDLKLQEQDPVTVTPVSPLKHSVQRLNNLTQLIEIAKNSRAEQLPAGGGWHQAYSRHQAAVFRDAQRHLAFAGGSIETIQNAEVLRGIKLEHPISDRSIGDGVAQVWLDTQSRPDWSTQHFLAQTSGSITLASSQTEDSTFSRCLALSAWLAGMTFLAMVGVWRGLWAGLFHRWPHLCGVAVGLAWWIWLLPEAMGLLLVLLSLASCFRFGWRKTGQSASAIVSLTLNDP